MEPEEIADEIMETVDQQSRGMANEEYYDLLERLVSLLNERINAR